MIGFHQDLAVVHVGRWVGAFHIVGRGFHLLQLRLLDSLEHARRNLAALRDDGFAALGDGVGEFVPDQRFGHLPQQLFALDVN